MSRRNIFRYRLMCLLITIFMILMGVRVEVSHADSHLERFSFGTVSLQNVSTTQETVVYRDNSILSQLESFTVPRGSVRSMAGTRFALWLTILLVPADILLQAMKRERSVILCLACENQYRRRTLEYIHRADGKKA